MSWFEDASMVMTTNDEVNNSSEMTQVHTPNRQDTPDAAPDAAPEGAKLAVPAACVACRTKHLKCDGLKPCSRCRTQGVECSYVRSRRGYKGPRKNTKATAGPSETIPSPMSSGILSFPDDGLSTRSTAPIDLQSTQGTPMALSGQAGANFDLEIVGSRPQPSNSSLRERCIEAFFQYFFPAHPFILPKFYVLNLLKTSPLPHLEAAMRYIGSHYIPEAPSAILGEEAMRSLSNFQFARDGFAVQASLLVAIGLDASTELKRAHEFLTEAINIALEIGMQQREFAALHSEGSPVMEESWRRTWWELYVVDGMVAGVHQQNVFRLYDVQSQVLLPCEEHEYILGRIPTPHSLEEFDDDGFVGDDVEFSSFSYRITAIRNFGRVLQLQHIVFADDPIIHKTDAHLVNWDLHLPASKKLGIDNDGKLDEMIFQAQMIKNGSLIMLHRAHSQLDTSVVRSVTSCAPHRQIDAGQTWNVHAAKIVQAAENIGKLISLPTPLIKHTPFFACVITLSSIVHLSCWAALLPLSQDDNLKQQLRLMTGALKTIGAIWPNARTVQKQIRGVAQEVFVNRKAAAEVGFWNTFSEGNTFSEEDMIRSIIEDEVIINGFQLT